MKVLMVGLGSIGQRHLRNLKKIFGTDLEVIAYRVRKKQTTFTDSLQVREGVNLDSEYRIKVFDELEDALECHPDVVFITTITSKHQEVTKKALSQGFDVFIEKPLSDKLDGVNELIKLRDENKCVAFVGFQNRYHPCIQDVKRIVDSEIYGNILSVQSEVGELLTTMHKYEDYSETYMARKDMGGGVIVNQLIHELDYLRWIFGMPVEVYSIVGKRTNLDIDVEDCCDALMKYHKHNYEYGIHIHADFIQSPPKRFLRIIFEKACVTADLLEKTLTIDSEKRVEHIKYEMERNDMFISELGLFFDFIKTRKQHSFTIEEGIDSLKLSEALKLSSMQNKIVSVKEMDF